MFAPVFNPFRFYNPASLNESYKYSLEELAQKYDYLDSNGFCHKLIVGDETSIQFHDVSPSVVTVRDRFDVIISTPTVTEVATGVTQNGATYNIYQVDISWPTEGYFYIQSGAYKSEFISVSNSYENITLNLEFRNYQNTLDNYFDGGFFVKMRVSGQAFKRQPESTRSFFNSTTNKNLVLAQRNTQQLQAEFFDQPPFMHEILSYAFSLSSALVNGDEYVSEEGYALSGYLPRVTNSNSSVVLKKVSSYAPPTFILLPPTGLTVGFGDGLGMLVSWMDNSNETGFVLQRSTSADFTTALVETTLAANITEYLDATGVNGTTYYFRVKATSGTSESDWSNVGSIFYTLFEFTYDTANTSAGSTTNAELKLPLLGSGTYDFFIDWGDASPVENITTYNQTEVTHNFGGIATGTVRIAGTITGWAYLNTGDRLKILNLTNWGNLKQVQSGGQFLSCTNLNITATDIPDLSGVGNTMANFFAGCISLVFNSSINSWDVSGCPDLNSFFNGCNLFNQDISGWDVSSNTNLNRMFQNCFVFNQPLDAWDVSNVTGFGEAFANAKVFNQNLNSWNVSASSSFFRTFRGAAAFDGNISAWTLNPLGGVNMNSMFRCDLGLVGTFNQDITGWDMSKVNNIQLMLDNQDSFNQNISSWNVSNCNSIFRMFVGCAIFNQPIGAWNTSGFTSLDTALTSCPAFDQNLAAWDVTSVTNATSFLSGSTLSTANYDALLIGWEAQAVQNNVVFHGGNSTYTLGGAAEAARAALIADHSWTITDGGGI